ncbi:MAG: hypothetical protein IT381_03035 [Deltaproteobacteria bacterium]|nr:hypothetical protein [Deltaproteobacteria bacterium]
MVSPATTDFPITFHLFGDVAAGYQDAPRSLGFALGQLDFFAQAKLTDSFRALVEVVAEFGSDGTTVIDLERVQLTYQFGDWLSVTLGRTHAPFGYYNTTFHHGAWLETQIGRPRPVAFEDAGGILPVHQTGIEAFGRINWSELSLGYHLGVGNGRGVINDDVLAFGDRDLFKSLHALLYLKADRPGLRLGGDVYYDRAPAADSAVYPLRDRVIEEWIIGAHLVWQYADFELLGEYYHVRHTPVGDAAPSVTHAYMAIASYQWRMLRPYVVLEGVHFDTNVPDVFFAPEGETLESQLSGRVGLKVWFADMLCLKAEYAHSFLAPRSNTVRLQVAFGL